MKNSFHAFTFVCDELPFIDFFLMCPLFWKTKVILFFVLQYKIFAYGIIDSTYRENEKKCCLTVAKEPIPVFSPVCMVLQKNGPFTKPINEQ